MWCDATNNDFESSCIFVDDNGSLTIEKGRLFLIWLAKAGEEERVIKDSHGKERKVSRETFDQATKWLKMVADKQLSEKGVNRLPKGHIMTMPGVKESDTSLACAERMRKFQTCTDTDQRSDLVLTFEQMRDMAHGVLASHKV